MGAVYLLNHYSGTTMPCRSGGDQAVMGAITHDCITCKWTNTFLLCFTIQCNPTLTPRKLSMCFGSLSVTCFLFITQHKIKARGVPFDGKKTLRLGVQCVFVVLKRRLFLDWGEKQRFRDACRIFVFIYQVWTPVNADSLQRDACPERGLHWPPSQDFGKKD